MKPAVFTRLVPHMFHRNRRLLRGSAQVRVCLFALLMGLVLGLASLPALENPFFGSDQAPEDAGPDSDDLPDDDPAVEDQPEDRDPADSDAREDPHTARETGLFTMAYARTVRAVARAQRQLNRELSELILDSTGTESPFSWLPVLGLAFMYGVLHAVLPGHRKTVLISYYIAEPARLWHGIFVGFVFAVMHVVSAAVIVGIALGVVQMATGGAVNQMTRSVQVASSWLIIAIGVFYLVMKIRGWLAEREEREAGRMREELSISDNQALESHISRSRPQSIWPAVLSAGIVPCPVTTSVLLFSISIGAINTGIAAVLALSAGLGVALSLISILTIILKAGMLRIFERRGALWVTRTVELAGVAAIIGFGVITLSLRIPF